MAEVVLVHGIGPLDQSVGELHGEWTAAISGTLRAAGETDLADRLATGHVTTAMAYYRDLFKPYTPRDEWDQPLPETMAATAQRVGRDLLENVEDHAANPDDRAEAARELTAFREDLGPEQGVSELLRLTVGSLARCGIVARSVFGALKTTLLRNLAQVAAYLEDEDIRERAQQAVLAEIGPETRAVYAHSLGTVVAYEALHRLDAPLPLLVTFGSPLGLRTIVRERVRPQPPCAPPQVARWVNVADRDDYIVASMNLRKVLTGPCEALEETRKVSNPGLDAHPAVKYLGHDETVLPLAEALRGGVAEAAAH
ncbi:hypothetical protein [Streptomyces sp. NPDC006307]|uniref:hypothetical protein n=1 Tax=Streptomyces sp. NPDC006307 TaxID=3156748 RepID=UPI0033B9DA04